MNELRTPLVLTLLAASAFAQTDKKEPASQVAYKALVGEYGTALAGFQKALAEARTPEEKRKVFAERHPSVADYAPRFVALARRYPKSPAAVEALLWVVNHPLPAAVKESALRTQALETLQDHHADDPRVGGLCTQLVFTADPASEAFLGAVLEKSSTPAVQARACVSLAVNRKYRARLIGQIRGNKEALAGYEQSWGKPAAEELLGRDPAKLRASSEKLFERVVKDHGEIKHPTHGTLANFAKTHLAALREPVTVGKLAPDVEAEDFNGKRIRLSQFRGKVVLLDFWASIFQPCQAMYGYERELVKRMAGQPFVLLGVNGDSDWPALRKILKAEGITWNSFWDGGNVGGPIATRYDVDLWPTLVLLDHKGVVRQVYTGWPDRKVLDEAIEKLVEAAKARP